MNSKSIKLNVILLALLFSIVASGQNITGQWNGLQKVQKVQLRIVFNITKTDSTYTSTMDSPDQGVKGIPVTSTVFANSELKIAVASAGIKYEGKLNNENVFVGNFKQGGQSFPMTLSKEAIVVEKKIRPQEPAKPYPYYTEDVVFENKKDKITLAGTLSMPSKDGVYPVVILITGSGPQNRDEELLGHKPFLVISDYLTRKGIAVLRYDDRGTFESKGDFKTATTIYLASDAESAVEYLKTRKEINGKKIGLMGHSEGGLIAPIVAANNNDVSFIVLLAGTAIPGNELMLMQKALIEKAYRVPQKDIEQGREFNKGAFDIIIKQKDTTKVRQELTVYFKQKLKEFPRMKPLGVSEDAFISQVLAQLTNPWMMYFIAYDPSLILPKVKCPVLALNGEKDLQVPSEVNLTAIKKALKKGGNKNVTTKELPKLNHLFQECKTGSVDEYATIEQTFSPSALDEIYNWILSIVK